MSRPADYGDVIALLYAQVRAPLWAARNLDALADVLRDLSWLPAGPIELRLPELTSLSPGDSIRLTAVLRDVAAETAAGAHPIRVIG